MRIKKNLKKITALALCLVLLVSAVPTIIAASVGTYNPAPYFEDEAWLDGSVAWIDAYGNIQVEFPAAKGAPGYTAFKAGNSASVKKIDYYVVQLTDLGKKLEVHNSPSTVLSTKKVDHIDGSSAQFATFTRAEMGAGFNDETNRYNVSVTAVDEDGWFSVPMHSLVSDVPKFLPTEYELLSTSSTAAREMFRFEAKNSGYLNDVITGGLLQSFGAVEGAGEDDPQNNNYDSTGYGFLTLGLPSADNPQQAITAYSRQHWDGTGADEVWFWFDGSQISIQGLSFELYSNNKYITMSSPRTSGNVTSSQSDGISITYSTRGYKGGDAYAKIIDDAGIWQTVSLTNGTISLDHYKGYVRIPIEFICSTEDSYVDANLYYTYQGADNFNDVYNTVKDNILLPGLDMSWNPEEHPGEHKGVLVDPAGTSIRDAHLVQRFRYQKTYGNLFTSNTAAFPWYESDYTNPGNAGAINGLKVNRYGNVEKEWFTILAKGRSESEWKNGGFGSYVDRNTMQVVDTVNPLNAIEDVCAMGFTYTGLSADSVNKGIYIDNVIFYSPSGSYLIEDGISGDISDGQGRPISYYYDENREYPTLIFDKIDQYISSPDWSDYRQVAYLDQMIADIKAAYDRNGRPSNMFTIDGLTAKAVEYGREDSWNKYLIARQACEEAGTLGKTNNDSNDLVPLIVQTLEKLPDPDTVVTLTDDVTEKVIKMWQAYQRLNEGQLRMLSGVQEEKLLKYIYMLDDDLYGEFAVGNSLANSPYILFNDFEKNVTLGEESWRLENDWNNATGTNGGSVANDYRHTKGFITYAGKNHKIIDDVDFKINTAASGNEFSMFPNACWGNITDKGYKNSKAATVTIDVNKDGSTKSTNGGFYTVTVSKNSLTTANFDEYKANNMSAENLGSLSKNNDDMLNDTSSNRLPLSLVFYVDFTELENFNFAAGIFTNYGGNDVYTRLDMGTSVASESNRLKWRTYYMLDTETGMWKRVQNSISSDYQYMLASKSTDGVGASIEHYRGYIAIPLQHFKTATVAIGSNQLDRISAAALNGIYAVKFGISGELEGKHYTIDNVGFTYDADFYGGIRSEDITYDEMFDAKSDDSVAFEKLVDEIDPYGADIGSSVAAAYEAYNILGNYQKTSIETVVNAKAQLDLYQSYVNGTASPAQPEYSADELINLINALPARLKNAGTDGDNNLPYPGYVSAGEGGAVNYAEYGLADKADADRVMSYYENSFLRYSKADKQRVIDSTGGAIENAYDAAKRCSSTLEDIKTGVETFSENSIHGLYTPVEDAGSFFSVENSLDDLVSIYNNEYNELFYYSKLELNNGIVAPKYKNAMNGFERIIVNTNAFTLDDGTEITGGYQMLLDKYTDLYERTKAKLDGEILFTAEEIQEIKDTIEEYEAFIPAYHNILELYEKIEAIKALFPVNAAGNTDSIPEIAFTDDDSVGTVKTAGETFNVDYSEVLPVDDPLKLSYITVSASRGGMTPGTDKDSPKADYTLTVKNGTDVVGTWSAEELKSGNVKFNVDNNKATPGAPLSYTVEVTLEGKPNASSILEDMITFELYDNDGAKTPGGLKQFRVTYTVSEAYSVTIPAEIQVDWNDYSLIDASYTVNANLSADSVLKISATANNGGEMTASGTSEVLNFTVVDGEEKSFTASETNGGDVGVTVNVKMADGTFDTKPLGEYTGTMTYTVDFTNSNS